jgi:hypothetical protein
LYGAFVWARRALNGPKRRFPARAGPGFLDNRGAVINIANAINIKLALAAVASARVIVLSNYHSLLADRANGVRQLATMLLDLFGNLAGLKASCGALLVGISQAEADLDEGLLSFSLPILVDMANPHRYNACQ